MMTKNALILGAAVAAVINSGVAVAASSGNIGVASNYIWRGVSQTADGAATSGGLDWSQDSGIYAGTWVSNIGVGSGYEQDFYAGFAKDNFDVGVIVYAYPVTPDANFTEVFASGSFGSATVGVFVTVNNAVGNDGGPFAKGDMYLSGSFDVNDMVSVYAGHYSFDEPGVDVLDYTHVGVSVSKDDFTFAFDKNDIDVIPGFTDESTDNMRMTVSWGKEFEL